MRHALNTRRVGSAARVVVAFAALFVVAATPAHAQNIAKVTIDFAFSANGTSLEPGDYEIEATSAKVILRSASGKAASVVLPVITRLGRHDNDKEAELVFDKVGGKMLLSEFWFPELDGYLMLNTPVDHEHRVIGGSRPRK